MLHLEQDRYSKRQKRVVGDTYHIAIGSGQLDVARMQGHVGVPLSTVPELDLPSQTASIARSKVGTQAGQLFSGDAFQIGPIGENITNPMVLRDRYNGAIVPELQEQEHIALRMSGDVEDSRMHWLEKLDSHTPIKNETEFHKLHSMPIAELKSFCESTINGPNQDSQDKTGSAKSKRKSKRKGNNSGEGGEYPDKGQNPYGGAATGF